MRLHRSQRGANIVEAALTLIVFFTFIFAIIEFGRAYNIYQVMTDAAREGARFSVAPYTQTSTLPTSTAVQDHVKVFLNSAGIQSATINVNQSLTQTYNGSTLAFTKVQVQAPYQFFFFKFGSVTMSTQVVMRNENN